MHRSGTDDEMGFYMIQRGGAALLIALIVDQATKTVIRTQAEQLADGVPVMPGFNLMHSRNEGVAFGLFTDAPWWVLSLVAGAICVWLLYTMVTAATRIEAVAAGLIVGGALGNIIDRIRLGGVTDFLDFHVRNWHWPAFNFADVAVVCGAAMLLLHPMIDQFSARK